MGDSGGRALNRPEQLDLSEWLAWQETLNPAEIDLGLDRPRAVASRMDLGQWAKRTVCVAGTNGKGSCVAFLEAICLAGGVNVAAYTSPHLVRYNERVRVNGDAVADDALVDAFRQVESVRGGTALTAFEFQTLAALVLFRDAAPDLALLEVGLGGRLDAVNLIDADVAIISSVDLDHQEWLGTNRDTIGSEKAGIARRGRPAIVGDPQPPQGLLRALELIGAQRRLIGTDFRFEVATDRWHWFGSNETLEDLPMPTLKGSHQLMNASASLEALASLGTLPKMDRAAIENGLVRADLGGRFQVLGDSPEVILDVAHNPSAARMLARSLNQRKSNGKTLAVLAMLVDKDATGVCREMSQCVDAWYLAGLRGRRGAAVDRLSAGFPKNASESPRSFFASVEDALQSARRAAAPSDRIVVFGSFQTVGEALAVLQKD